MSHARFPGGFCVCVLMMRLSVGMYRCAHSLSVTRRGVVLVTRVRLFDLTPSPLPPLFGCHQDVLEDPKLDTLSLLNDLLEHENIQVRNVRACRCLSCRNVRASVWWVPLWAWWCLRTTSRSAFCAMNAHIFFFQRANKHIHTHTHTH